MTNEYEIYRQEILRDGGAVEPVIWCDDCGKNPADYPSKICVGCDAYREHQR